MATIAAAELTAAASLETVSPGDTKREVSISEPCPTFSWQAAPDRSGCELVVYVLDRSEAVLQRDIVELEPSQEVLYEQLPGGVSSWTPDAGRCLKRGEAYAWFVRPLLAEVENAEPVAGAWSLARYFVVSELPTEEQVADALDVLRAYLETGGVRDESIGGTEMNGRADRRLTAGNLTPATKSRSVQTGISAVKGEVPDASGETYGVVGLSSSPNGAGLAAANLSGGADIVLDGEADDLADTMLSESGIDRSSASAQTFAIDNSGGGGITLEVDGTEVVTTATDSDTTYQPGNQLALAGTTFNVLEGTGSGLDADLLDGNDSGAFSPVVHEHDERYFTETELATGGSSTVHWDNLTDLPEGFDDGVDDDTVYAAGVGVGMDGGAVNVLLADRALKPNTGQAHADPGGYSTSIAVGPDGLAVVFGLVPSGGMHMLQCEDIECSSATLSGGGADANLFSDTVIGADGQPISVWLGNGSDYRVYVKHWGSGTNIVAPAGGWTSPSIAVGSDGLPIICYGTGRDLWLAHCDDVACSTMSYDHIWQGVAGTRIGCSAALGADGRPILAYTDDASETISIAHCDDATCSSATLRGLLAVGSLALIPALTIGRDGLPLIAVADTSDLTIRGVHCDSVTCASFTTSTIDAAGVAGGFMTPHTIDVGFDGLPALVYTRATSAGGGVRYARCRDFACSSASYGTIIQDAGYPSMVIGADGRPLIAYQSQASGNVLRVRHCANEHCVSYFRPR